MSVKKPNRQWKVPKHVLNLRLDCFWISVFRVRALCVEIHRYDPEIENFDQTPYYHNECGSRMAPRSR